MAYNYLDCIQINAETFVSHRDEPNCFLQNDSEDCFENYKLRTVYYVPVVDHNSANRMKNT